MRHGRSRPVVIGIVVMLVVAGTAAGAIMHPWSPAAFVPQVLFFGATLTTGWLLAIRRPDNVLGTLFLGVALFFALGPTAHSVGDALLPSDRQAAAWAYWVSDGSYWLWVPPVWTVLIWIPLHFPDGRLPSVRWRALGRLALLLLVAGSAAFATSGGTTFTTADPAAIPFVEHHVPVIFGALLILAAVCFVGTVVSLVMRYRHGGPVLRAQLRWMLWAVAVAMGLLATSWALPPGVASDIDQQLVVVGFALIPVAMAIAVLRYRLYEIDRIISRTAAYTVVTLAVVGTYAFVVLVITLLLPGDQDRTPPIVIALATLAAAAVFLPALRRIRRLIDRVFNRSQYDAERVVLAFGERIRNGADPHTAGTDLLSAVGRTLQPTAVGLWTRKDAA